MSELFEFGQRILKEQPFSVLIGAELEVFEQGKAVLSLRVRNELKQQHGFVHGGVVSYLADNALTYAGGSVLGDSVTSEYKINTCIATKGSHGRKFGPSWKTTIFAHLAALFSATAVMARCSCITMARSRMSRESVPPEPLSTKPC